VNALVADRIAHEQGLARFLKAQRRERFVQSLSDERLRDKLGRRLAHHDGDFDDRYVVRLEQRSKGTGFARDVCQALTARGAPGSCFVVAPRHTLDGAQVDLEEALQELIDYGPAIISCVPGHLGAYVGESANPVLLLHRRGGAAST